MSIIIASSPVLLLSMPSGGEWIWLILIVVLLFGGKKLPELAKGLGKGIREFNDAKEGVADEIRKSGEAKTTPPAPIVREQADI